MQKYEVLLFCPDEYSSPVWVRFSLPGNPVRKATEDEYVVTVYAEDIDDCRKKLDKWFLERIYEF